MRWTLLFEMDSGQLFEMTLDSCLRWTGQFFEMDSGQLFEMDSGQLFEVDSGQLFQMDSGDGVCKTVVWRLHSCVICEVYKMLLMTWLLHSCSCEVYYGVRASMNCLTLCRHGVCMGWLLHSCMICEVYCLRWVLCSSMIWELSCLMGDMELFDMVAVQLYDMVAAQ